MLNTIILTHFRFITMGCTSLFDWITRTWLTFHQRILKIHCPRYTTIMPVNLFHYYLIYINNLKKKIDILTISYLNFVCIWIFISIKSLYSGVRYIKDMVVGNCSVFPLRNNSGDSIESPETFYANGTEKTGYTVHLKNPLQFMKLDSVYDFIGSVSYISYAAFGN